MKRGIFRRGLLAVGSAALIVLAGSPSLGQAPKSGGVLSLRLREDLPQGFAINESPTISTMWPAMPCFNNLVLFDPMKPTHSVDTIIGGARRTMVVAGELSQVGLPAPDRREVARRQPVHVQGRQAHVRPPSRSPGRSGQAPSEPTAGVVRQRGVHRRRRSPDGRVPP